MNKVILIGRLTADPTLRYTPAGVAVATFSLAIDRPFTSNDGKKEADFPNCVSWRQTAELISKYTKKGHRIAVEGRLQTRSYNDKDDRRIYVTEVVVENVTFLQPKENSGYQAPGDEMAPPDRRNDDPFENESRYVDLSDDQLPF